MASAVTAIEDYALIGNCETAALVSRCGSIDWLCMPRFDSPACFASLLGSPENGRWLLAPTGKASISRRYRPDTLVLETTFHTEDGSATVIDFMPLRGQHPKVLRMVRGDRGVVRMKMDLVIRFDYGRTVPWVTQNRNKILTAIAGPNLLLLRASVPLRGEELHTVSEFTVSRGKMEHFELQYSVSYRDMPPATRVETALRSTELWWHKWISHCKYSGRYAKDVRRSLITLKAMTYAPTGGIIAAPTTSISEVPHGKRNWDYRYCWVRDATFALLGFLHTGFYQEASDWKKWLARAVNGSARQTQVLYGAAGERLLREWRVPWLAGYRGAKPVRVGNAASSQLQLDLYGEVADVLYQLCIALGKSDSEDGELLSELLGYLRRIWRRPDHGIWEIRQKTRQYTHSKVMAWVAFDRAIRSAEQFGLQLPIAEWKQVRQQIHDDVCKHGFNSRRGTFVQCYESCEVDASLLLIPLVGFLPPTDTRVQGTVRRIEESLMRGGFLLRYKRDPLKPSNQEGAFLPCTFWLADYYLLVGRKQDATRLLRRLLAIRNDVGLLSEEYHPTKRCLSGNFPQTLSHVALVNTIVNLFARHGPAHQRSGISRTITLV